MTSRDHEIEEGIEAYYANLDPIEVPDDGWTKEIVEERLREGIRTIHQTTGRVGPKSDKGFWPSIIRDWGDLLGQVSGDGDLSSTDAPSMRLGASQRQMTLATEALEWPPRYVADENQLKALNLWLAAKAARRSWKDLAQAKGIVVRTAERNKARAVHAIITGLTLDGVEVRRA